MEKRSKWTRLSRESRNSDDVSRRGHSSALNDPGLSRYVRSDDGGGGSSELTRLGEKKALSFRESQTLERARKLLIGELSEVMGETKSAAGEQIDKPLKA